MDFIRHAVNEHSAIGFLYPFELADATADKRSGIIFIHAEAYAQFEKVEQIFARSSATTPIINECKDESPLSRAIIRDALQEVSGRQRFSRFRQLECLDWMQGLFRIQSINN